MPHLLYHQPPLIIPHHHHHNHHHHHHPPTINTYHKCQPLIPSPTLLGVVSRPQRIGTTRCMANQRRVKMVGKQIQRELSDMLLTDKVLQFAVLPEAALGADRYLSSLTTITDVQVSSDLQVVKVFVSVFGDERGREVAITGLKSKVKYVRHELGRRMKLRLTPEIRFIEDESIERGSRVIAILDRIKNEKRITGSQVDGQYESANLPQDESGWEGDDQDDEGIIYIK